jgi:streptogramin lyase
VALAVLAAAGTLPDSATAASGVGRVGPDGAVTYYDVGGAGKLLLGPIVVGSDGNAWVVAERDDMWSHQPRMLRIASGGTVTQFSLGTDPDVHIEDSALGSDGNVWFTEGHASRIAPEPAGIGRITPAGEATEFSTGQYFYSPRGIATGPDGSLWMTDWGGDDVVRVTTAGELTDSFRVPELSSAWGIVTGPDGNLWFAELGHDRVARMTTSGALTEFSLAGSDPTEIAAGPDGRVWFVETSRTAIGRVTTSGSIDQLQLPLTPEDIATGADGNVYVTGQSSYGAFAIGGLLRISPSGTVTKIPIRPCSYPGDVAAGPDGSVWFTDGNVSGCSPYGVAFSRHGAIDRHGVTSILVACSGGDPFQACDGVTIRLTATVSYPSRGRHRLRMRTKTVTVGATRLSLAGPPGTFGRTGVAKVRLTRAGRRQLARSYSGRIRVVATMTFAGASSQHPMILTGPKRPHPSRRSRTTR